MATRIEDAIPDDDGDECEECHEPMLYEEHEVFDPTNGEGTVVERCAGCHRPIAWNGPLIGAS